jgi:hypothetical protein
LKGCAQTDSVAPGFSRGAVNILQIHRSNTIYGSSDDLIFPNSLGKPMDCHDFARVSSTRLSTVPGCDA